MKRFLAAVLAVLSLVGTALATEISDIRGYVEDEGWEYMEFGTFPYEEDGTPAPVIWRILKMDGNVATMITEYILDVHQVIETATFKETQKHKYRSFTEFRECDLYTFMNGEMLDTMCESQDIRDALIETESGKLFVFTSLEYMNEEYGFPHTKSGSTVEQPGEVAVAAAKRRMAVGTPYAKAHRLYENWDGKNKTLYVDVNGCSPYWGATLRRKDGKGYQISIIGKNGHISWSGFGSVFVGVRPAAKADLSGYRVIGGSGTLEDPWRLDKSEKK